MGNQQGLHHRLQPSPSSIVNAISEVGVEPVFGFSVSPKQNPASSEPRFGIGLKY
jgi:hypothetical protein